MPRYLDTLQNDVSEGNDGDAYFIGVNDKLSPEILKQGYCASATNKIFLDGRSSTRLGCITLENMNIGESTTVYGASSFSDANGKKWVLVATDNIVYRLRWDSNPKEVEMQADETNSADVYMIDALDQVLMMRGEDNQILTWEWGEFHDAFKSIPDIATSSYTLIPMASHAALAKNRLWVPYDIDTIAVSNALEYYQYDAVLNTYRVGAGGDDGVIKRLFPFYQNNMIVFKEFGTYLISNIYADADGEISTNIRIELLSSNVGLVARDSVQQVGKELFFLSKDGVRKISQNLEGLIESIVAPVSDAIEGTIRRINWQYADGAASAFDGRYYYLAVPLDDATTNTSVLVYDARVDAWMGVHTFPSGVRFDFLVKGEYLYREAIYGVNANNGDVYLLYAGYTDRINGTESDIDDEIITRGYALNEDQPKAFRRVSVAVDTWGPKLTLKVKTDGENNITTLKSQKTYSNTTYTTWGSTAFTASNVNDDHSTKNREDYVLDTTTPFYLKTGVQFDRHQNSFIMSTTRQQSRYAQIMLSNEEGRCELVSAGIEGPPKQRHLRDKQ